MTRGRVATHRYDVWTNAGRTDNTLFRLLTNVPPTTAVPLVTRLEHEGWVAELRATSGVAERTRFSVSGP